MTFELARLAVSAAVLPLLCSALIIWRYPPRTTVLVMAGFFAATLAVNAVALMAAGYARYVQFIWVVNLVILLGEFVVLSRLGGWRLVFPVLTGIALFCAGLILEALIGDAGGSAGGGAAARFAFDLIALAWLILILRPAHRRIVEQKRVNWKVLAAIPALYMMLFVSMAYPAPSGDRVAGAPLFLALVVLLVLTYQLVYFLFRRIDEAARHAADTQALRARAVEIEQRMAADRREEQALLIERHDMRHRLDVLAGLLAQGRVDEAAAFINQAHDELARPAHTRFCRESAIDAVLGAFAERAQARNVTLSCSMVLPDPLPVDALGLAVALANALENALAACTELPGDARRVSCSSAVEPCFVIEVANSCAPGFALDAYGMPCTDEPGHGFGTRSIAAFAQQHGATCDWRVENGRCILLLAFPNAQ